MKSSCLVKHVLRVMSALLTRLANLRRRIVTHGVRSAYQSCQDYLRITLAFGSGSRVEFIAAHQIQLRLVFYRCQR